MSDPFQKYLSVSASADAFRLLALTPGQRQPRAVLAALQSQLTRINNHPDGQTPEAERVRQRLYEAARVLLEDSDGAEVAMATPAPAPSPPAPAARSATTWAPMPVPIGGGERESPPRAPQRPILEAAPPPAPPRSPILTSPPDRLDLTAFDRHVLAILVACGDQRAITQ